MATSEGNNEVAPVEVPQNKGEIQEVKVNVQPNDGEREPMDVDEKTDNRESQSGDIDVEPKNVGTPPAQVNKQPEIVEALAADVDMQPENAESGLSDSKDQPTNDETKVADAQPAQVDKQPEIIEASPADVDMQPENAESGPFDSKDQPTNGVTKVADTQPAQVEKRQEDVEALPADVDMQPGNIESGPSDSKEQKTNEETKADDAQPAQVDKRPKLVEALPGNVDMQEGNARSVPSDSKDQPNNEETKVADAQPNDAVSQPDAQPSNGEKQLADTPLNIRKAQPVDGQSISEEKQPTNVQPNSAETQPAVTQPSNEEIQSAGVEIQLENAVDGNIQTINESTYGKTHSSENGEVKPVDEGESQPADADLQPNNTELQPVSAHMQSDSGEIQTFGAETQLKNEEIQAYFVEYQPNNGEMHPYSHETHPQDAQMQPYNIEMQLHDEQIQPYEMQIQEGQLQPYNPETQPQDGQIQPYNPETQPNKKRKRKSVVWEHFTIETVSPGCRRAICNRCKQSFAYSTGSKVAGTSHLKRHIAKGTCAALIPNQDGNSLSPFTPSPRIPGSGSVSGTKRRYRTSSTPYVAFDQERCRLEIAKMIIMHDYPLHIVEHSGFVSFVQNLQPHFDVGSFSTVQGDCIGTYLGEKQNVMRLVEGTPGRVCLSLDLWTSNQSVGYVIVTGHFVDSTWKYNRRILNVVMEPYPESDTSLSHALSVCLSEWSLEGKVFSIAFSRHLNDTGFENLRAYLAVKNPHILNGQLLVGTCIGHNLCCMAKDLLEAGQDIVKKVRDSVKYVMTSDSHMEKFVELKRQLQVPSEKSLLLDDLTNWSTTYEMLLAASELKEVFSCLDTTDPDYKKAPSMEVWKQVETLCTYLKLLYDAANVLTNALNPTPITCFHEVWKIHSELGRALSSEDPFVVHLTRSMHEQLIKYWKDCSLILAMAVVMDPRFKMKLVEFTFTKLYGEDAPTHVRTVDESLHELFDEYVALPLPLTPTYTEEGHARDDMRTDEHGEMLLSDHGLTDFDMYIMETTSQQMKSEIDQYLEESLLPRVQEIDVLSWWKLNKLKYPTLSKMARDILTTPVCTVTSETIFDTVPRKMDAYRNTLRPVTVEALICAKDWLPHESPEVPERPGL